MTPPSAAIARDGAVEVRPRAEHATERIAWLDVLKGLAMLWIVWNHYSEALWQAPAGLSVRARMASFAPGRPILGAAIEILRLMGAWGDHAVGVFIILSGLGLALARSRQGASAPGWRAFWVRRVVRLYPMWLAAHAGLAVLEVLKILPRDRPIDFVLSALGVRFLPSNYFLGAPAWWYFGLQFQLYLVFPLLWIALERWGARRFVVAALAVGFGARALGAAWLGGYAYPWLLGAVFVTRLPCFAFGMVLGAWFARDGRAAPSTIRSLRAVIVGAVGFGAAIGLQRTVAGPVLAAFTASAGLFPLLSCASGWIDRRLRLAARGATWVGNHSLSIFLVHHVVILVVLPVGAAHALLRAVVAGVAIPPMSLALERVAGWGEGVLARARAERAVGRLVRRAVLALFLAVAAIGVGELVARRFAPAGDALGWGERPSLEPHDRWGWRLRPGSVTRLRWLSYDYRVTSNSLGLPGPEPRTPRPPDVLRVLTAGDAFTSAEGVDTELAWPRLLERRLRESLGRDVEVVNAAVTGWGPNQYAAAIEDLAPALRPDVILIGFFINDPLDAAIDEKTFRGWIGFANPDPDAWPQLLVPRHLRELVSRELLVPLREVVRREPSADREFLTGVSFLGAGGDAPGGMYAPDRMLLVERQLRRIHAAAEAVGAATALAVIPAPAQVCEATALPLFPRGVDLADRARWDLGLPQRLIEPTVRRAGFAYDDLRPPLRASGECPYQRKNLHFTALGHRLVADHLAASWSHLVPGERARTGAAPTRSASSSR